MKLSTELSKLKKGIIAEQSKAYSLFSLFVLRIKIFKKLFFPFSAMKYYIYIIVGPTMGNVGTFFRLLKMKKCVNFERNGWESSDIFHTLPPMLPILIYVVEFN